MHNSLSWVIYMFHNCSTNNSFILDNTHISSICLTVHSLYPPRSVLWSKHYALSFFSFWSMIVPSVGVSEGVPVDAIVDGANANTACAEACISPIVNTLYPRAPAKHQLISSFISWLRFSSHSAVEARFPLKSANGETM